MTNWTASTPKNPNVMFSVELSSNVVLIVPTVAPLKNAVTVKSCELNREVNIPDSKLNREPEVEVMVKSEDPLKAEFVPTAALDIEADPVEKCVSELYTNVPSQLKSLYPLDIEAPPDAGAVRSSKSIRAAIDDVEIRAN